MSLFNTIKNKLITPNQVTEAIIKEPFYGIKTTESKGIIKAESTLTKYGIKDDNLEDHPFDFQTAQNWAMDDPFASGMIDKYIDFTIGSGMILTSDDDRALKVLEEFRKDVNFDSIIRTWARDGLTVGNGFLQITNQNKTPTGLKLLPAKTMYVSREATGKLLGYSQVIGTNKTIPFKPEEIAHFAHKKISSSSYGIGLIWPITFSLFQKTILLKNQSVLMVRKANAPIVATVGTPDRSGSQKEVESVASDLETINNKTEYAVGGNTTLSVLDFGKIGDKFTQPIETINQELYFGSGVPAVLMGIANISEGQAKVQMDGFLRRISSIQEEIERIIEEQIFRPVLDANGLENSHVEIEWELPTNTEKNERIEQIRNLLANNIGIFGALRLELEKELSMLMGFEIEEELDSEAQREHEETQPQPEVPGQKPRQPISEPEESVHECNILNEDALKEDYTLQEWIGFNYSKYVEDIDTFLDDYNFIEIKDLTDKQRWRLRAVLKENFKKGGSIRDIARDVREVVKVQDLKVPAKLDKEGNVIRKAYVVNSKNRSINIARTETIRASSEGTLINYKKNDINKVEWLAAFGERTCPECEALNGTQYTIAEASGMQPLHNMCRCAWAPVIEFV